MKFSSKMVPCVKMRKYKYFILLVPTAYFIQQLQEIHQNSFTSKIIFYVYFLGYRIAEYWTAPTFSSKRGEFRMRQTCYEFCNFFSMRLKVSVLPQVVTSLQFKNKKIFSIF
jgi:hypothetical protein